MSNSKASPDFIPSKSSLLRLLLRISIYYAVFVGILTLLVLNVPQFADYAPVGGVGDISGSSLALEQFEEILLNDDLEDLGPPALEEQDASSVFLFDDARALLFSMIGSVLLMLPVAWVYKGIHEQGEHDQSLDETTLILPAVVAAIVMIVQHSLALAFSLAGIVAGVQFRRALSDTFDTLFIFVAIAVGIAAGIQALDIAFVLTVFFNFATLLVCLFGDGIESHYQARKKLERRERKEAEAAAAVSQDEPPGP